MDGVKGTGAATGSSPLSQARQQTKGAGGGFDVVLKDAIGKVTEVQADAEKAIRDLSAGGDVTQAIIAMEKADMSFQAMVEVRNKLLSAYDEIMRMQV